MFTVAQYYLIIVQLDLKDSSHNYTRGYEMSFISYPHLILLISGQTLSVTVALKKILETKRALVTRQVLRPQGRQPHRTWEPGSQLPADCAEPVGIMVINADQRHNKTSNPVEIFS